MRGKTGNTDAAREKGKMGRVWKKYHQKEIERDRQRVIDNERYTEREREINRGRKRDRQREKEIDRERKREKER